jgi:iron complex outermembrane recepter protein
MTRSPLINRRPLNRADRPRESHRHILRRLPLASAISAILAGGAPVVHADTAPETNTLEEVVVTAQKRTENLQDVPISIQVFDTTQMEQLHIVNLDDYVKLSPSMSYVRSQGQGGNGNPGSTHIYMRGVVSGGDGNHSGSQPSVGTYLDEQPVTTIDGTVDVHLYDIQRIEILEGPQGTLYGASSEAGTVRIITNKPDPTKFSAGYDVQGNQVDHGGKGYEFEGFVNIPLSPIAAVRLVGWDEHDAGYIDNVAGTSGVGCITNGVRPFPAWSGQPGGNWYSAPTPPGPSSANVVGCPKPAPIGAGSISNAPWVQNNYNTVDTKGGRAALKFDLDNWTIMPTVMGQSLNANGFFGSDPSVGDLEVVHFGEENSQDSFVQSALTVEGKFNDFDLVYAGAFMKRDTHSIADYADYSEFYDRVYGSGAYWTGNNGKPVMPQEFVIGKGYFQKWSQEVRLSTPQELPVRATVGLFIERQQHRIWQDYTMPGWDYNSPYSNSNNPNGFATALSIPGLDNTIWLTDETRVDRDKAAFAQVTWDITQQLSASGGIRYYEYDNTIEGFFGYSAAQSSHTGQSQCFAPASTPYAPCTDLDNRVTGSGNVPRLNLTYKFTNDKMIYATYSKGFRPGGVNRTAEKGIGPYEADFLKNYEIGWKTDWLDHRLRWNGAIFWEDWNNFQFSFLGLNSVTIIVNGGDARIKGIENEFEWAATNQLTLGTSFTFLDPRLTQNYCGTQGVTYCPNLVTPEAFQPNLIGPQAPSGTNLPVTPKFKGNMLARYTFDEVAGWKPFTQASWVYQTQTTPQLRVDFAESLGKQPAYGLVDLTGGATLNDRTTVQFIVTNVADRRAELTRFAATVPNVDNQPYFIPGQPRTFTIKFGQKF